MPYASQSGFTHARPPHAICIPTGIHTRTGPYTSNWICTVLAHHKAYKPGLGPTVQDRSWVYAPTRIHIPQDPGHMRPPGHTSREPYASRPGIRTAPASQRDTSLEPRPQGLAPPHTTYRRAHSERGSAPISPWDTSANDRPQHTHPLDMHTCETMRILPHTHGARAYSRFERGCRQLYTFPRYRVS